MIKLGETMDARIMIDKRAVFRRLCCTCISEFDTDGKIIHAKTGTGFEQWYEYGKNRKAIHWKTNNGSEAWYEYDDCGNEIFYKNAKGSERRTEYDESGRIQYEKTAGTDGTPAETFYEYRFHKNGLVKEQIEWEAI